MIWVRNSSMNSSEFWSTKTIQDEFFYFFYFFLTILNDFFFFWWKFLFTSERLDLETRNLCLWMKHLSFATAKNKAMNLIWNRDLKLISMDWCLHRESNFHRNFNFYSNYQLCQFHEMKNQEISKFRGLTWYDAGRSSDFLSFDVTIGEAFLVFCI